MTSHKKPNEAYRIVKWHLRHENSTSHKWKKLPWVRFPTNQETDGIRKLKRTPNGIAIFGAYAFIVEFAATLPVRGVLATSDGPIDAVELAHILRIDERIIEETLSCLTAMGWFDLVPWPYAWPASEMPADDEPPTEKPAKAASHKPAAKQRTRPQEAMRWSVATATISAQSGPQAAADRTSAAMMFAAIWPDDAERDDARIEKAYRVLESARSKDKPMAWLSEAVKQFNERVET